MGAYAQPILSTHVPDAVRNGSAVRVADVPASQHLNLAITLPLRNEQQLDAFISSLYDPASLNFRQYLSVADFTTQYGPSEADFDEVLRFAAANHLTVTNHAANRLVVDVAGRAADVEKAFHVHLGLYKHPTEARNFYAPDAEPSVDLNASIQHVEGLDNYALPFAHFLAPDATTEARSTGTGSGPSGSFLGSDIRAAYYGGTALTGAGQSVGLLEMAGYNLSDVQTYFSKIGQPLNVSVVGVSVNGASLTCTGKCDDSEQVLDIEQSISMAPGLSKVQVYVGTKGASILNQMASDNTAKQLSSSWGWRANASGEDPIYKEFQAQGQSFVDATGDDGYHLAEGGVWPADDPNVTAIGGTTLVTNGAGGSWKSEAGWTDSGGGPSPNKEAIPSYQVPFITTSNGGSKTLRNVPDVAGVASNFYVCADGSCTTGYGGTSFAAPLWAGFIALVNQQAASQGHAVVGWLNPTLYTLGGSSAYATEFHDETSGNNGKYNAVSGFDLVTGFGSPQGQTLINAIIKGS